MMEQLLQYATKRIVELERLLLVDVTETVWPAEVGMVYKQIENASTGNVGCVDVRIIRGLRAVIVSN